MTIGRMTVGLLCVCATAFVWARTGTLSVEKDGETFNVTFANHVGETNGLWVVYGAADRGEGTNGWGHVEFLQTVYPATGSVTYPVPAGWGDSVRAIRFILSEVPYDCDYTLDFLRYGDFSYGTFGDFNMLWGVGHPQKHVEKNAAPCVPRLTVAKCNHHACDGTHPRAWIKAVSPRVWLGSVWSQGHLYESILEKLAETDLNPRLRAICPTYFSAARRIQAKKHGKEAALAKMPDACFKGAHVVITVPPGGKTFRLSQVDAGREDGTVLNEMEIES